MSQQITIRVDSKVRDRLGRIRDNLPKVKPEMLESISEMYAKEIRSRAPTGATGHLKKSIFTRKIKDDLYEINMKPYAWYVEMGKKATGDEDTGGISTDYIKRWADMKNIPLWALKKSIDKKGTKPHPFIRPGLRAAHPKIKDVLNKKKKDLTR